MSANIYAIGDVHGCYDKLLVVVAKIKAHAGVKPYRVVFLGDYVDRGPDSRRVVNLVRGLVTGKGTHGKWFAIRGNHEDIMATALAGNDSLDMWECNGGGETKASYRGYEAEMREHSTWLQSLPAKFETENHIFVHAGLSPRYSLDNQPEEVLLWIRGWERDNHDFGKHVVYGHTPRKAPLLLRYSSGLDTGACFDGPLTVGVFDAAEASGPVEILEAR